MLSKTLLSTGSRNINSYVGWRLLFAYTTVMVTKKLCFLRMVLSFSLDSAIVVATVIASCWRWVRNVPIVAGGKRKSILKFMYIYIEIMNKPCHKSHIGIWLYIVTVSYKNRLYNKTIDENESIHDLYFECVWYITWHLTWKLQFNHSGTYGVIVENKFTSDCAIINLA